MPDSLDDPEARRKFLAKLRDILRPDHSSFYDGPPIYITNRRIRRVGSFKFDPKNPQHQKIYERLKSEGLVD